MSIFNDNINSLPVTAAQIASFDDGIDKFGRFSGWLFRGTHVNIDNITKEDIDNVLSNILSYIYYLALIGINNTYINKHEVSIPGGVFGLNRDINNHDQQYDIIIYIIGQLRKNGFESKYNWNNDTLIISWNKKYYEIHNI